MLEKKLPKNHVAHIFGGKTGFTPARIRDLVHLSSVTPQKHYQLHSTPGYLYELQIQIPRLIIELWECGFWGKRQILQGNYLVVAVPELLELLRISKNCSRIF